MRRLLALALLSLACARPAPPPSVVYFVRHAEKALDQGDDPPLTPQGAARASALAARLGHAGIERVYATEYRRTQETVEPLARLRGLTPQILSSKQQETQVAALTALPPGSISLVAGHSNTVPKMIRMLGGSAAELADPDYDRVFVVSYVRTGTGTRATASELRLVVPPVELPKPE